MDREANMKRASKNKPQSGLAAFTSAQLEKTAAESTRAGEDGRQRGKHEIVGLNIRFTREQWGRVHQLAITEGVSIQKLVMRGLSQIFREKGLTQL
jgi:hypothetical protein